MALRGPLRSGEEEGKGREGRGAEREKRAGRRKSGGKES